MKAAAATRGPATKRNPAPPRVLTVRRQLVRPAGDRRRLLHAIRNGVVRRVLVLGAVLVALSMVQVWLRLQVVNVGYDLSSYREWVLRLEHERQELEVELATLRDRRRLEEIARNRLGMTEPARGQVVEVE
ncbi:MAG: cell division protein FtsL [Candidatus Binatia bacterium]